MHGTAAGRRAPSSPAPRVPSPSCPRGGGSGRRSGHSVLVDPPGQPHKPPGWLSLEARRQPPPTTALQAQAPGHRCPRRRPSPNQMALRRLLASRHSASVTSGTVPCFACCTGASEDKRLVEERPPGGARPQPAPATKGLLQNTGQPSGAHHFRVQKASNTVPLLPTEAIEK